MNMRWLCVAFLTSAGWIAAAHAAEKPNILLCIADDVSYPHMGAYGCSWVKTPGFDRVAKQGLLFTRAYTPNAKCSPSRACLLTGRNSWELEAAANHTCYFPARFKTFCEALGEQGYFVGVTGKGWSPGDPGKVDGQPRRLTGRVFSDRKLAPPTQGISAVDYAANFREFLAARPQGTPFCFWYGGYEPHRVYEAESGMRVGGKKTADIDRVPGFFPDTETVRHDLLDYAYEIEHFDRHLQAMLTALEEAGELDNTLVVVTSDNGMPFPRCKGQSYEMSNHLPLAIMWKRGIQGSGRRIDDLVSFIDFAPTFLEIAGVDVAAAGMQPITGRSLTPIFQAAGSGRVDPQREILLVGKERHDVGRPRDEGYPIRGIVQGEMLYLRNYEPSRWPGGNPETGYMETDGSPTKTACIDSRTMPGQERFWRESFGKKPPEELYNVVRDPECLVNLAMEPAHLELKQTLERRMGAELTKQRDPRMSGQGHVFEAYPYASDSIRGFYEKFQRGEKVRAGWIRPTDIEKVLLD